MQSFEKYQSNIFTQLKEDQVDPRLWSLQEVKDALNDTYLYIAEASQCFKLVAIIQIKTGIRVYKLPSTYVTGSLGRVEFNEKKIWPTTSEELDAYNRSWRIVEGSDITHYLPPDDICASDEIAVYPKPDTDGAVYNTASDSEHDGVIVATGDDSYSEFSGQDGVIVATDGEAIYAGEERGPVIDLYDPENNLRIFAAKFPKRLSENNEVFLHPVNNDPKRILILGSMAILLSKEGEGKDIIKASYYNKRFEEALMSLQKPKVKRIQRMRSITDISINNTFGRGLNLGENYPSYIR